jgi:two-component system, LytTR family, sensor histidine kinase AlgZ
MPESPAPAEEPAPSFYLPDLCAPRMVLGIVLTTELIALLLTTARLGLAGLFWDDLARTSVFLLWIALGAAGTLCSLRPQLARLGVARGSALALGLLLVVTGAVSELAWWAAARGVDLGYLGGLGDSLPGRSHAAFLLGNLAISLIVGGLLLRYFYVTDQWRQNVEGEARARIDALQARIRPHFLYNSMNTIAALTRSSPAEAERAVEDLADLFRASLAELRDEVRLADELEIARTYQRIEQLRLGARLRVDWQLDALPGETLVPGMFLQPLLENAIYHGIERLPAGGTVTISARRDGATVEIVVDNPLPDGATAVGHGGNRIALANLRERLALLYAGSAGLTTEELPGRFVARLRFPAARP